MKLWRTIAVVLAGAIITGCEPGLATGGGWVLEEATGKKLANFGFNVDACEVYECEDGSWAGVEGSFNYVDRKSDFVEKGGVKMNGEVLVGWECTSDNSFAYPCNLCYDDGDLASYLFEVYYRSTNPFEPGYGKAWVCAKDFGEGVNRVDDLDWIAVKVTTGPFDGYELRGDVQGNIRAHVCVEED